VVLLFLPWLRFGPLFWRGVCQVLLTAGAQWSDKDLAAMVDDVTLGHERNAIKIDMGRVPGGAGGATGRELLSRLRRFVYIRDCVSEADDFSAQV
jgi:hypothetical protein